MIDQLRYQRVREEVVRAEKPRLHYAELEHLPFRVIARLFFLTLKRKLVHRLWGK